MLVAFQSVQALTCRCVPDLGRSIPGAADQLLWYRLAEAVDSVLMAFEEHGGVAFVIDVHDLPVFAGCIEAVVTHAEGRVR